MNAVLTRSNVIRHALAAVLLIVGWRFLSAWYLFQNQRDYVLFSLICLAAFGLAAGPLIPRFLQRLSISRILILFSLAVFALPWGELLHQTTPISRLDWGRELFRQGVFIYSVLLFFRLFPNVPKLIQTGTIQVVEWLSARRYLFWLPPALFFCLTAGIALFVFDRTPVVVDSAAHLFQAKILKGWHLYAPVPTVPDFFSLNWDMLVMKDGRWFSMYQPAFAALLALAMTIRAEWFVSPVLGAITLAIWMQYARRWHNTQIATVLGWISLFSPFLFLMSSSVMVFTPELFLLSATIYECRREIEQPARWRSAVLFLLLCALLLVRAFSSFPFVAPLLGYTCWNRFRAKSYLSIAAIACGLATGVAILMYYQWKTTGNPFLPGYLLEYPDVGLGFGQHWIGRHTPLMSLENLSNSLLGLNHWLTGWYSGTLVFLVAFFLLATKIDTWDRILLFNCLGLAVFYFFFLFQDLFFGPRYYFPVAFILLLLVARTALMEVPSEWKSSQSLVTALCVISFLSFLPKRLPNFIHSYNVSQSNAGYLKEEIQKAGSRKTLVFLDKNIQNFFVNWNDPFLRDPVIICRDLGERNAEAIAAFAGYRPVYFRLNTSLRKATLKTGYKFYDEPDQKPSGYVSLFHLAMVLESGKDYPDRDCFDIAYEDLFNSYESASQIAFLRNEGMKSSGERGYKENFRLGLIHSGQMLLLPKLAFEERGLEWENVLDRKAFRREFNFARDFFSESGEVGKGISSQLDKVANRIDQNRDQVFSDDEITAYLTQKINIVKLGG